MSNFFKNSQEGHKKCLLNSLLKGDMLMHNYHLLVYEEQEKRNRVLTKEEKENIYYKNVTYQATLSNHFHKNKKY